MAYLYHADRVKWSGFFKEFPLRTARFALAASIVCGLAVSVFAAAPATPPATAPAPAATAIPATAPASAPSAAQVAQEGSARKALGDFFQAMFDGDQKAAFDFLVYTDAKNQPVAEKMFGEILAEQRVRKAVTAAFGADKSKSFDLGMGDDEVADFKKELAGSTVKLSDKADGATIQMGPGPTFVLVKKGDAWQVDFDKTQANMGPLPQGAELDGLGKQIAGYDQLAKDVAAKKFDTVDAVSKQVDKVKADSEAKGPESQPAPATAPAAGK